MASLIGRVEDLVVEDREVEGKAKTDRMSGGKVGGSDLSRSFVCFQRLVGRDLALITLGELGEVTVVITLPEIRYVSIKANLNNSNGYDVHLVVEYLRLAALSRLDQVLVKNDQNIFADIRKLSLDLLSVFLNQADLGLVALRLFFLLD